MKSNYKTVTGLAWSNSGHHAPKINLILLFYLKLT